MNSLISWLLFISFIAILVYWKCIRPKSIKNILIVISFVISSLITAVIVIPILVIFDNLESSGTLKVPDLFVMPADFLIIGAFVGIQRYSTVHPYEPLEKLLRKMGMH